MTTISSTVYSSLSALNTYSVAIDVTSTNIANAESAGYSRQTAIISEKLAADGTGYGVDVETIKRSCDSFLTSQLRNANQELGKSGVEVGVLSSIEQVFSDTGDSGLSAAMGKFWNAWQEVVNDPSGSTARSVLATAADTLADTFNDMSSALSEISAGIENSIDETVTKINDLVQQIGDANQQLVMMEASGQNANFLKDTLDSQVQELSSLIDIEVSTNDFGQINVELVYVDTSTGTSSSISLVSGTSTFKLNDDLTVGSTDVTNYISSGKLGGYLEGATEVSGYQKQLDELAKAIMGEVNALHTSGIDLDGNAGLPFFTGTGSADMAVNDAIINNPGKIAAASDADVTGDGSSAAAIAELQNSSLINGSTFSDFYNALVSEIGATVQDAETGYERSSNAQAYFTNACLSVSGVSTDEEMAKLVLYQNAYEAAAKIMTVLDELMQTLIEM